MSILVQPAQISHIPLPSPSSSILNTARQTQYFLRCLKTHLPTVYQSSDSQRLSFAYFALSALDLLGVLQEKTTVEERQAYADWIYKLQHEGGGWKGFTGADVGRPSVWDPANLGSTFFALGSLMVLGDDMTRVRRWDCLTWMKGLQRPEGNFGEARGKNGSIEGGGDARFCYLATSVRWILRRGEEVDQVEDIDVEALVGYVERSVTYEGGIAEAPGHEAHAGETFCGIAALKLLGRLPLASRDDEKHDVRREDMSDDFVRSVTRWLVYRQTLQLHEEDEEDEEEEEEEEEAPNSMAFTPGFQVRGSYPARVQNPNPHGLPSIEVPPEQLHRAGFNGRCNKVADTCYAWWVGASLGVLNKPHLQNFNAVERYLLDTTQHRIGGFSKTPGDPPDILHSYLGLATLAVTRHPDLKTIDPVLCMSVGAREQFEQSTALGRGENSARSGYETNL